MIAPIKEAGGWPGEGSRFARTLWGDTAPVHAKYRQHVQGSSFQYLLHDLTRECNVVSGCQGCFSGHHIFRGVKELTCSCKVVRQVLENSNTILLTAVGSWLLFSAISC